jgi:hypothetical protein
VVAHCCIFGFESGVCPAKGALSATNVKCHPGRYFAVERTQVRGFRSTNNYQKSQGNVTIKEAKKLANGQLISRMYVDTKKEILMVIRLVLDFGRPSISGSIRSIKMYNWA